MDDIQKATDTSVALIKLETITQIISRNSPQIVEKVTKAKAALSVIQVIDNDEQDLYANNVLTKCNSTVPVVEKLRKEYTGLVDKWKAQQMEPEKELAAEMDRVRALRNIRANNKAAADKLKAAEIEKEKNIKIHESEVKVRMKESVENGVLKKLTDLGEALAKLFNSMTLENCEQVKRSMQFKPNLKEDFFKSLVDVPYNNQLIDEMAYTDLKDRAIKYFDYTKINAGYVDLANKTIESWKEKIPFRIRELEQIAQGGDKAQELIQRANDRATEEEKTRVAEVLQKENEIKGNAAIEHQSEVFSIEFQAQNESQDIKPQDGTRNKISYRLAPESEKNFLAISALIGKIIIHVMTDPDKDGIFKKDGNGVVKKDDKGNPVYVEGIAYWLTQLEKVKYNPEIPGLVKIESVITIAKAK